MQRYRKWVVLLLVLAHPVVGFAYATTLPHCQDMPVDSAIQAAQDQPETSHQHHQAMMGDAVDKAHAHHDQTPLSAGTDTSSGPAADCDCECVEMACAGSAASAALSTASTLAADWHVSTTRISLPATSTLAAHNDPPLRPPTRI